MFAEDDVHRRRAEREAADAIYNDALTALDQALPRLPDLPHPPVHYDEHQITPLNERWQILGESPAAAWPGWRGTLARFVWELVRPVFERQQSFNSALVDHINRNVSVHRANHDAIESSLGALRAELEKLQAFHTSLILYLQTITAYVDTKDRSEHIATLGNFVRSGLSAVSDEFARRFESAMVLTRVLTSNAMLETHAAALELTRRIEAQAVTTLKLSAAVSAEHQLRWESMVAREQRQIAAADELRTSMAAIQQTGLTLKRELERLMQNGVPAAATLPSVVASTAAAPPPAQVASAQSAALTDNVNAYKYVGFENKFRGSEAEIRQRQLDYASLFAGASDVLDLGCGRGEFLLLLHEQGIGARGLDINHEMVEICRTRGLTVDEGDALPFLRALPDASLGGLVALQVVEHMPPPYLLQFLDVLYQKLRPGSTIVLETVNPASWFAFFEAYLRDITHAWPLHPDTLKYLVLVSGFQHVEIRYSSPYPTHAKLQACQPPPGAAALGMQSMVQVLNENAEKLNSLMFGYLDYAVVGKRG